MDTFSPKEKKFSAAEVDEAKKFGDFFVDLLNNHKENLIFYLADTAVLDWFGRTIKGPRDIRTHLKNNTETYNQHFTTAQPVSSIGFRESHLIKYPSKTTGFDRTSASTANGSSEITPPQPLKLSVTQIPEMGQGDGLQNNYVIPESPMKKCKLDDSSHGDNCMVEAQMKYLSAEGHVEFRKKSSKKLQTETKWNRPCKLEVAYCANNFEDCTIYMMIYQGNMKCRRNLLKDFDSCEPDD